MERNRWVDRALVGSDGARYFTVADAAQLVGLSPETVRRVFDVLDAGGLVDLPRAVGRPTRVVRAEDVEARRSEVLGRLGVRDDEVEVQTLRHDLRAMRSTCDELLDRYEDVVRTVEAQDQELHALRLFHADHIRSLTRDTPA